MKSSTPWRSGVRPVATVVQTSGETVGSMVCVEPVVPPRESALRFGRLPSSASSLSSSQSAPSMAKMATRPATPRASRRRSIFFRCSSAGLSTSIRAISNAVTLSPLRER
jgi:hypothetical protein